MAVVGSTAIMIAVLYLAHGFSARTTTALVGTLFGLTLVATALAYYGGRRIRAANVTTKRSATAA